MDLVSSTGENIFLPLITSHQSDSDGPIVDDNGVNARATSADRDH